MNYIVIFKVNYILIRVYSILIFKVDSILIGVFLFYLF